MKVKVAGRSNQEFLLHLAVPIHLVLSTLTCYLLVHVAATTGGLKHWDKMKTNRVEDALVARTALLCALRHPQLLDSCKSRIQTAQEPKLRQPTIQSSIRQSLCKNRAKKRMKKIQLITTRRTASKASRRAESEVMLEREFPVGISKHTNQTRHFGPQLISG
jgi:hypothetical protein